MNDSRFAEKLLSFLEKLEYSVTSLVILGCIVLLCSQLALTQIPARKYLSYVDQLEGQRIEGEQGRFAEGPLEITEKSVTAAPSINPDIETRLLIISLMEALPQDKAFVLVNGHDRISFVNGEAVLNIKEGDVLEIDGSRMEKILKFRINTPHNDIEFPMSGLIVETKGNIAFIGAIHVKH